MSSAYPEELDHESAEVIQNEIRDLEEQLARAKARLNSRNTTDIVCKAHHHHNGENGTHQPPHVPTSPSYNPTTHFHLLLADSALPLGSFAFSSGLESYLAHTRPASSFTTTFLPLSIASYASTTLPFLLAAHRDPTALAALDDALDAAVICTVGKRASIAQGRALLGLWERSFVAAPPPTPTSTTTAAAAAAARRSLADYAKLLRSGSGSGAGAGAAAGLPPLVAAHLAPLFGAVAHALGLSLDQTAYVFLLGHVKALVSAAVRANLLGPYAAQRVLASPETQAMIRRAVVREWATAPDEAGQGVPVMDLWVGRHEVLYSRIFNS